MLEEAIRVPDSTTDDASTVPPMHSRSQVDRGDDPLMSLSPERRALLALRLSQKRASRGLAHAIPRRAFGDTMPLSCAQERLWFLDQLESGGPLYNVPMVLRVHGVFCADAFRSAFAALVARHEILRTRFTVDGGVPYQAIDAACAVDVTVVDLRSRTEVDRHDEAMRLVTDYGLRPFNLADGPLVRALLVQHGPEEHLLGLTLHHIVADGWSRSVLWRELAALYEAAVSGRPPALPPLEIQYADFAIWQRRQLRGAAFTDQLAYWTKRLAGAPPLLALPTDRPRPSAQTGRGASQTFAVSRELGVALRALGQREEATLFMVLLAAFQVLLARYTGLDDIIVGSPVAGRTRVQLESLIGLFVNTLVMRTDVSGSPMFLALLRRVRQDALDAYAHQDVPFERLVEELQPQRQLSHAPVVQVLFALQNMPAEAFKVEGVHAVEVMLENTVAKFDMSLVVWEKPDGLVAELEYSTDLFDRSTIDRLIGHYQTLLEGIVANPECRIDALPLLTPAERRQVLVAWNTPRAACVPSACIHQLIEARAALVPDATAVVFEGQQLTYRELNERANQLAHLLHANGAGCGHVVGLSVEPSLELVVGVLGVLKSGAAFLPLDPAYPADRLCFMARHSRVDLVVTTARLRDRVASACNAVTCLDLCSNLLRDESRGNPSSLVEGSDPAYVMYTSGSTGTPKGALIEHEALARHSLDVIAHYELGPSDRVLQFASLSFDTSLEQILPPLAVGAAVVLRDTTVWSSNDALRRLSELDVTVADFPTAYLRQLVRLLAGTTGRSGRVPRLVTVGGEALTPADVALLKTTPLRSARLLNAYGPTEATITATTFDVTPLLAAAELPQRVPIGRPLGARTAFILDRLGNPVPIGVAGELFLGGTCLARGYLHEPALTAERFVDRSFDGEPSRRLYRTGDLARYLADGTIEFLGRADHQVKVRGFRVELGEVEAVLRRHPAVREVVVLAVDDGGVDTRLVAYVVAQDTTSEALRDFVKQTLPDFMVPAACVCLEALPLTLNGKLDRRALPAPECDTSRPVELHNAPRLPMEETVAQVWTEALKRPHVGVHDNFFEIGGHSLLVVQVQRRLSDALGKEISVIDLFRHPTIRSLACFLNEAGESSERAPVAARLADRRRATQARRQRLAADAHRN